MTYLRREKKRYREKGYGFFFSVVQLGLLVYYLPVVGQQVWPMYLALGIPEAYLEPVSEYWVTMATFLVMNGVFMVIYKLEWECLERYKINLNPWPWQQDPEEWRKFLAETLKLVCFNKLVFVPVAAYLGAWQKGFRCSFTYDLETLPDSKLLVLTFLFCFNVERVVFSATHQLLHAPALYARVHKTHHSYTNTVCISTEYAHPLEYLLGNILPVVVGPALLGKHIHLYTVMLFFAVRIVDSSEQHSGYSFSWNPMRLLPFVVNADYHNFHHSHNVGNYSTIWLWDTVFGQNREYYKYMHLK